MGAVAAKMSPRWANASFGVALLWRSQAMAALKARGPSAAAARRLALMSLLLVSSRGRIWRWVREATGLPLTVQRVAILCALQHFGNVIPLVAVLISAASAIMANADRALPPAAAQGLVPAAVSGSMMYFLHERPSAISPAYRSFLRVVSGPSRPVLGRAAAVSAAAAAAAAPLVPALAAAAARALDVRALAPFFVESYKHNLRSFLLFYLVIRPVFRQRRPKARNAYEAARTALWVSLAGLVGYSAGRVVLPGRPGLTTAVRIAMGAAGSMIAWIDPEPARRPVLAFLMAQAMFSYVKLAEGLFRVRGDALERAVSVVYPVAGLLNWVKASSLTGVVIKAL